MDKSSSNLYGYNSMSSRFEFNYGYFQEQNKIATRNIGPLNCKDCTCFCVATVVLAELTLGNLISSTIGAAIGFSGSCDAYPATIAGFVISSVVFPSSSFCYFCVSEERNKFIGAMIAANFVALILNIAVVATIYPECG